MYLVQLILILQSIGKDLFREVKMISIEINDNNLNDDDIEMFVTRVKGLIINSRGKILLAHNNNSYQFPGGHVEDNESLDESVVREIKEETGIKVEVTKEPFLVITTYDNDYFGSSKKVRNRIYYYKFFTDDVPNLSETHYDELELATDFNLFYVNLNGLDDFLKKEMNCGNIDKCIGREMLIVYDNYMKSEEINL